MAQLSARGGFLDFSPIKKEDSSAVSYGNKENNNSHPVLSLIQFSRAPFVTFGNVKLGSSKSSVLCIENPVEDANIEVAIDKIASTKGFSVDQTRFTIQPEERVNLTITWTPIEEGGIRELITFIANGVVKHQAILLGRADAPKRRKKSLWDSIKSKKAFDLSDPPRGKKNSVSSLKMAANKTFHVSRTPQYRREKVRSPLASLNKKACTPVEGQKFKQDVLGQFSFDNVQKNSPVVFLVPAAELIDSSDAAASYSFPVGTPECRDLTRLLNTTVSPVGTPERLQKLMPHIQSIQSPAPVIDDTVANISHTVLAGTPVLSVRDALALIESDLTHVVGASPPNACSSFDFSHSLESANGEKNCGPVKSVIDLKALSESPIKSDPAQPRLTFFIKPKRVTDKEGRVEVGEVVPQSKKVTFTSATVIKSKPAPVQVRSPGVRRIKTSRRCLLEKTLELSGDSGHSESSPGTTVTPGLPVIDSDANHDSPLTISPREARLESISYSPVCLDDNPAPVNHSLSSPLPMNPPTGGPQHLGLDDSILGATQLNTAPIVEPLPDRAGVFPVYNQSQFDMRVVRSKKRKSDEFLRDGGQKVEDAAEKTFHVKKSRVSTVVKGPNRPAQQKGISASSHRQQTKTSASVCTSSASSTRAPKSVSPAQAKQPAPKPGQRGAQSLKSFGGSSVKTAKIVAVAQSKLTFTKPGQTAIPRHPMPFAAKNMFYDERWIEKQETGFTWWINYVLTPDDFKVNTEVTKVNAVSLAMGGNDKFAVNKAPTKEEMSFSTYTARRRLNRLRRSACQLFTSEPMVKAIQRLELEVEARRLLVRKDRHLWKDIGERQKVLNWLLSYNPLWLRIGLETIYGEMISLESNSDVMGLAMFILKRLLWNPDIAAEFRHAKVPNLYKDGHEGALSRFTLKKLLLLVCFLDKAKESRMIEHDPCLFCMDAEFKTTKDLLLSFSRDFLSGEGILPRHLGYMGLPVSHVQMPLDEFNFAVKNLSVDLKCGIRLVRVMELFIQDWSLSRKLRMPAISRLQKVHNVDIALQVLRDRGVDLKDEHDAVIDSRDIVDGHREKTLSLLWKIIFTFQVEVLLDEDQLREEISFLKHTWTTKQRLASLRADKGVLQKTPKPRPPFEHSSSKITLLMEWVNAVCQFYHLKAENFTVSFSDGRILCYLIHHYHPSHLPADSVSHNTTQTVECSQRGRVELNSSSSDSDISFDTWPTTQNGLVSPSMEFKELLENEKSNFRLVNTAVSDLGGVPAMMNPADMSNTIPNEKVVTCYLSFLCARLLDLRNETRAARIIQGAWRKYRLKKDLKLYQERTVAAGKIQVLVRQFLQRRRAVCQTAAAIRIQAAWRGYSARNALTLRSKALLWALQVAAATTIQAQWKKYVTLKNYQRLRLHIVKVQALWRMKMAVTTYRRTQWAATVIQKHVRASTLAREERERYCSLRSAAVKIQRNYRRRKTLRLQGENHAATVIQTAFKKWHGDKMVRRTAAALKIQSFYRMRRCLKQYMNTQRSAVLIQTWCRGHAQRRNFETLKLQHHSATVIQSAFRASTVRKQMATMRQSSVVIQRWFRASVQRDAGRQQFLKMRCAAVTIQSAYRGHTARRLMQQQNQAATVIQTAFMKFVARRKFLSLKKSAIVVQQRFRANLVGEKSRKAYIALQYSALRIQAIWRGRTERKRIEKRHKCATLIQSSYRRHVLQSQFRSRKKAALAIQSHYRAYRAGETIRTDYLRLKKAAVTVQARFRGMRVRQELRQKHQAAAVLQSVVRVFLCRRRYVLLQRAAIVLQCRYRALVAGRTQQALYSQLKLATVKLQAAYRRSRELRMKHQAATVIQAQLRMHKVRQAYLATKVAAIIVQQHYRANRLRDLQMQRYTSVKSAAVVIQAVYRGHRARMEVARMHHSAMVIQRRFLTFRDRKRFLEVKTAVLLCQQRCRDVAMVRKDQRDYLLKLRAATALQAAFKGMKVRKQLQTERRAAILIQSHVRKHLQRAHYKRLEWAVNTVQARYRANKKMIEDRKALRVKRSAVVVLQAAFRGMLSRQRMREMHKTASVLQRSYRAHCVRRQYLSLRSSVLAIQQKYRAAVAAKQQMQHYQRMRSAVILLQAAYRGQRARKEIGLQHQAATTIQAGFRKHREEVKFQAMKFAAIIIQRYFRSHIQMKQDRDKFIKLRESAIVLQAAFRAYHIRQDAAKMHRAASVIQANFRMHKEQVKFQAMRLSAVIIQRYFRSHIQMKQDRDKLKKCRESAIVLQAAFRGYRVRQDIAKMCRAATVIQANFRMHKEQSAYRRQHWAASVLQQRFRAQRLRNSQLENYHQMRNAVINLQALYRGKQAKELAKQMIAARKIQSVLRMSIRRQRFLKEKAAALLIQSAFRRHQARTRYNKTQASAVTIQRWYRSCNVLRRQRDDYLAIREAAVKLQSAIRGTLARRLARRKRAAVKIQSVIRMSIQRRRYLTLRSSTVKLQSHCRAWVARRRFLKRLTAAATLQKHYRGWQAQREQRCLYLKTLTSVKTLQARVRGHIQLKRYQNLKRSAVTIQAFYRGMVERLRFQHQRASAAIIQERFRAHLLCQRERAKYLEMKKSAVLIQAVFRGDHARQIAKKRQAAVATVHRCMQTRHLCNRFRVIQRSVRVIQCRWRETLKAREERHNFLVMKAAAVTIEASWRGHATRNHLLKEQRAAVLVQSSFRGWVQKRAYQRQREAALFLQRRVRAMQQAKAERVKYTRLKQATITVQAHCRGWIARRQLREAASAERRVRFCAAVYHHRCAVRIQRALRSHWALQSAKRQITSVIFIQRWLRARLQTRRYVEDRRRVVVAQRAARSWLARRHHAASTIQHAARTFLLRRREQRVQQGIIKAQALWRGHQSRKLHDNRKVVSMRHRLRKVSEEVREEDRLCNKTSWAIEYLLKYKHFSYILEALKNLETATRLSPECCERLVTSGATLVIFTLIRSCNRSVPSMEVITYAIQVLLNLSKYDKTIEAVYAVENSVDTLLDLLQIYREKAGDKVADKGGSIFTKACFLLIILLQDQSRALEVRKLSKAVDRLRSIYRLTARKHKMDAERTVVKQKMGASINGSFIVPATPRKSKPVPKFSPDWVLRRDKLQDIVDPLRAVQMVADVFSIVL
ncbi:abnormal spindle-like microcephaly-associated protein [Salvelinus alpinus]|uniref:abnormal spindle-like microcephaly-associated protein n=1 Tax=Salvelinus alpinus TaxID=8036 RepID=UPI0039FBD872